MGGIISPHRHSIPLKPLHFPTISALSIPPNPHYSELRSWILQAQELCVTECLTRWVGTLSFILSLCRLYSICVLGVLSYGHKKRIYSFLLSVSFVLSLGLLFPESYLSILLYSESLVVLVLRNGLFFLSSFSLYIRKSSIPQCLHNANTIEFLKSSFD